MLNDQSGTRPGTQACISRASDRHTGARLGTEQVVEHSTGSPFAFRPSGIQPRTGACPFVDRGSDYTSRVEIDDQVGQHDEDHESESDSHDVLDRRHRGLVGQTRSWPRIQLTTSTPPDWSNAPIATSAATPSAALPRSS